MNLLKETEELLESNGLSSKDVLWCGSEEFGCFSWDDFSKLANKEYSCGFGSQEVATDLLVVGDGWWLERHEYDGSEWWEFKTAPKKPSERKVFRVVDDSSYWDTLTEMNQPGGKYGLD